MMLLAMIALPCYAWGGSTAAADRAGFVTLADFAKGLCGFQGAIAVDPDVAFQGGASAKMQASFTPGQQQPWITATKTLAWTNQLQAVRFWARSTDADRLTVCLVDATGQNHQYRPTFPADGQWHQVTLSTFESGPGYQSWGGAGDKKFHWPAQSLSLILEKNDLCGGAAKSLAGTLWIDDVQAEPVGAPQTLWDQFPHIAIAFFDKGAAGSFQGQIQPDPKVTHDGTPSAQMSADFAQAKGDPWITASRSLAIPHEIKALRFWVQSQQADGLTVRLVDSTGQNFQQRPQFPADGQWRCITLESFISGPGFQRWGGADDGAFHWPAARLDLVLEKPQLQGGKGSLQIAGLEASIDPSQPLNVYHLDQAQLGNIFYSTEKAQFPLQTAGDQVAWTVTNFQDLQVADGSTPVSDGKAEIEPGNVGAGYFVLHMRMLKSGKEVAAAETTYAVLMPVDVTQMPQSRFGVMTHFAQGWNPDIIPLIAKAGITAVRDELYWNHVEQKPGVYTFDKQYDDYMSALQANHIEPEIVLSFANRLYDGGMTPYTPGACEAFGKYGQAVLHHYGQQIKTLEIWNEYNGSFCTGEATSDRPRYYTQLLKAAYTAIRKVRPDVTVIGGAAVLIPPPWFEHLFQDGALDDLDAIAIHPYRADPEGVEREVAALEDMAKQYNHGQAKPIWATENGRLFSDPDARAELARYMPRQCALLLAAGVQKIDWYLLRDYASFFSMGLLHDATDKLGRYTPAPAYCAYATVIRQLNGAKFIRRETTADHTYVELFEKDGQPLRVCWATVPAQLTLAASQPVTVVDLVGAENVLQPVNGQVFLTLTDAAVYVNGAATITDAPQVAIPARQTADVLGPVQLRFESQSKGQIELLGKTYAVPGVITLPDEDTSAPREKTIWYRYTSDGKLTGLGGVQLAVIDPLTFTHVAELPAVNQLRLYVGNSSAQVSYLVTNVTWKLGATTQTQALSVSLPPGQQLTLNLPIDPVEPNRPYEASINIGLSKRAPLEYNGMVTSSNAASAGPAPVTALEPLPASPRAAGDVLADSVLDYSKDQGLHNWTYGYLVNGTSGQFTPMKYTETPWGFVWQAEGIGFLELNPQGGHPGSSDGKPVWAVRRWTSPVDATIRITANLTAGQNKGDGVGGVVVVDGQTVWNQLSGGANKLPPAQCNMLARVKKGSHVDVAITSGPAANLDFDACSFTAQITRTSP
jgi:hypothetical protein